MNLTFVGDWANEAQCLASKDAGHTSCRKAKRELVFPIHLLRIANDLIVAGPRPRPHTPGVRRINWKMLS